MLPPVSHLSGFGAIEGTSIHHQRVLIQQATERLLSPGAAPVAPSPYDGIVIESLPLAPSDKNFFKIFASICMKKSTLDSRYQAVDERSSIDL